MLVEKSFWEIFFGTSLNKGKVRCAHRTPEAHSQLFVLSSANAHHVFGAAVGGRRWGGLGKSRRAGGAADACHLWLWVLCRR